MCYLLILGLLSGLGSPQGEAAVEGIELPPPQPAGEMVVEQALGQRRSRRSFGSRPLDLQQVAQLLWAAQGVSGPEGERTAPSAGALYPLELYLAAGDVEGLDPGIYRYRPGTHTLVGVKKGEPRDDLVATVGRQGWVRAAPAAILLAGVVERTALRYGSRATRYMHMEAGAVAENIYLQAEALGLATTLVGAFDESALAAAVGLRRGEVPLALLPVGPRRHAPAR